MCDDGSSLFCNEIRHATGIMHTTLNHHPLSVKSDPLLNLLAMALDYVGQVALSYIGIFEKHEQKGYNQTQHHVRPGCPGKFSLS